MSSDGRKRKRGTRLGKCDVCRISVAKYTCPRCETVTCSLECVKRHKKELDCDGVRVRTKYVPVDKMNEHNLLSDYRLLEDARRCVDAAEWRRDAIDAPLQVVADADTATKKIINKGAVPPIKQLEKTVSVQPKQEPAAKSSPSKAKKKCKKSGPKSTAKISKTDLLIARANRIRKGILNRQAKSETPSPCNSPTKDGSTKCQTEVKPGSLDEVKERSICSSSSVSGSSLCSSSITDTSSEEDDKEDLIANPNDKKDTTHASDQPNMEKTLPEEDNISAPTSGAKTGHVLTKEEINKRRKAKLQQAMVCSGRRKAMIMEHLSRAAYSRATYFRTLPEKFEKHWENTSFYLHNDDCIYWHLKVSFINSNLYTLTLKECAETTTLEDIVKGCLQRSEEHWKLEAKNDPLEIYRMVDFSKITVLMAADKVPNSQRKFYVLDMSKSLRENFEGKCIVEFPQFCIAIEDCHVVSNIQENLGTKYFGDFSDLDSDEEEKLRKESQESHDHSKKKQKSRNQHKHNDSDRESGELTDSGSDSFGASAEDSSSDDSNEELFDESEFRSIYKGLLCTFDSDIKQVQH